MYDFECEDIYDLYVVPLFTKFAYLCSALDVLLKSLEWFVVYISTQYFLGDCCWGRLLFAKSVLWQTLGV